MVMDALECIESRRSIRSFRNIPVEFEKLGNVLNAGRLAPSSGNLQDWKFILVTGIDLRKQLAEACLQQYWMEQAPVHIVVCSEPAKTERMYGGRGEELYSVQNCAAASQNILLAAHAQGLGACWVGAFDERLVRKALGIPSDARPVAVIAVGYPDEVEQEPSKHSLANITYVERWGSRIRDFAAFIGYYSQHVAKTAQWAKEKLRHLIEKWSS
jgi:nitroreductase